MPARFFGKHVNKFTGQVIRSPLRQAILYELVQEGAAAQETRDNTIRESKQQSAVERQQAAKDGVGHEAGSIAADRRHQARQGELERLTTTDPLAGLNARPSRKARQTAH